MGYSLLENHEVILSELMCCSLLDCLRSLRGNATLSRPRAHRYAIELARGMRYLHSCRPPVLHRDLKPGNLLLDGSNTIRISDFGLATFRGRSTVRRHLDAVAENPDALLDLTGETGSYRFMAPEVALHKPYGRPVDVYSFAMILYNLLDSRCPWSGEPGERAVSYAIKNERPVVRRDWDHAVVGIMKDAWHQDPNARPSFEAVLERFAAATDLPVEPSATNPGVRGGNTPPMFPDAGNGGNPRFDAPPTPCNCVLS